MNNKDLKLFLKMLIPHKNKTYDILPIIHSATDVEIFKGNSLVFIMSEEGKFIEKYHGKMVKINPVTMVTIWHQPQTQVLKNV